MIWLLLVILVAAAVVIGIVMMERRRSAELRQRFGPEYERAVEQHGARRAAEADLRRRLDRRRSTDVRELEPGERERFTARWQAVQAGFVDDPQGSVAEAARLIDDVLVERGYLRGRLHDGAADIDGAGLDGRDVDRDDDDRDVDDRDVVDRDGDGRDVGGRGHADRDGDGVADRYELVAVDHPALVERLRNAPRVGSDGDGVDGAPALSADDLRVLFLQHQEMFEALVDDHHVPHAGHGEVARS